MEELRREIRKRSRRFQRWSFKDLLRLLETPISGWLEEIEGRHVAIAVVVTQVARGRVAVLVFGQSLPLASSSEVESSGFVASPRKVEEIEGFPRIKIKLRRMAKEYATTLVTESRR